MRIIAILTDRIARSIAGAALGALVVIVPQKASAQGVGPFTQAQVATGHQAYLDNCAACHSPDLGGLEDAPSLTGQNFAIDWSRSTVGNFYKFVATSMPTGTAGDLSPDTYNSIIAYLLAANGAKPGPTPFDKTSDIRIGDIANGNTVAAVVNGQ